MNACFRVGIIVLCLPVGSPTQPIPQKEESDVYAIYSLMLTKPRTSHGPDDNEIYLIGDRTSHGFPEMPCVRPPAEETEPFSEVMADFNQRKDIPRKLEPAFKISKPFRLLTPEEVTSFEGGEKVKVIGSGLHATDLFHLTDVYFDRNRTLALTQISTWCGGLCGLYQWKVFEKSNTGDWQEKDWVTCTSIADVNRRLGQGVALPSASKAGSGNRNLLLGRE